MHSISVCGLNLLEGTGEKALATDHRENKYQCSEDKDATSLLIIGNLVPVVNKTNNAIY